jgi:hypothetical protein
MSLPYTNTGVREGIYMNAYLLEMVTIIKDFILLRRENTVVHKRAVHATGSHLGLELLWFSSV